MTRFYSIFLLFVLFTESLSHPTGFSLTQSEEESSFDTFVENNDADATARPSVAVCADGRRPLLEGDGTVFACAGNCPDGFDCEHYSEGFIDKGGICCPDLNELYRLYGKNETNEDGKSDQDTAEDLSSPKVEENVGEENNNDGFPVHFMESRDSKDVFDDVFEALKEKNGPSVLRFSSADIRRRQEKQLNEKNKYNREEEIKDNYSCRRQQLDLFCEDGVRQTQFVMRWYYKEGNCISYPWGYCPGAPISSDPTLRTEEECQRLCVQPLQEIGDLLKEGDNLTNSLNATGEEDKNKDFSILNIETGAVAELIGLLESSQAAKKQTNLTKNVAGKKEETKPFENKKTFHLNQSTMKNSQFQASTKILPDVVQKLNNTPLESVTTVDEDSKPIDDLKKVVENNLNQTENSKSNDLLKVEQKLEESLNKKKEDEFDAKDFDQAVNNKPFDNTGVAKPHERALSSKNVELVSEIESIEPSKPEQGRDGDASQEDGFKFHAASSETTFGRPQKRCEKIIPYRAMCKSSGMPSQFTLRWHLRGNKCELYPYGYCHGESVQNEEPIKTEEECVSYCIKKKFSKQSQN